LFASARPDIPVSILKPFFSFFFSSLFWPSIREKEKNKCRLENPFHAFEHFSPWIGEKTKAAFIYFCFPLLSKKKKRACTAVRSAATNSGSDG